MGRASWRITRIARKGGKARQARSQRNRQNARSVQRPIKSPGSTPGNRWRWEAQRRQRCKAKGYARQMELQQVLQQGQAVVQACQTVLQQVLSHLGSAICQGGSTMLPSFHACRRKNRTDWTQQIRNGTVSSKRKSRS